MPPTWRSLFKGLLLLLLATALSLAAFVRYRMQGPYRDYRADAEFVSAAQAPGAPLLVGVATRDITPDLASFDPWTDANGNGKYDPFTDTFEDRNRNGEFDFVWMGGFGANRPAKGVNDPLWTRAIAFRHGGVTLVLVSIDSVGLTHERFIALRKSVAASRGDITYVAASTTHTHQGPDTMGIWSFVPLIGRFDEAYVSTVVERTRDAVLEAVARLQPADAIVATEPIDPIGHVNDSRMPKVFDRQLNAARFVKAGTAETIATLVSWGNHPEAMGEANALLSSDFPHYWREGIERGLPEPNGIEGLGGTAIFVQGPIGGLMTPIGLEVRDRDGVTLHRDDGVAKARALGEDLAVRTIRLLGSSRAQRDDDRTIAGAVKTIFVPIAGTYRWPIMLGMIHPGWYDGAAKSEVSALRVGGLEILTLPGEVYPEIVDGGVESPPGADRPGPPVEVPPLRPEMRGAVNMVFNLANDEIGYVIPRTEWDEYAPWAYGQSRAPYGEINSTGPDSAAVVHREALDVIRRLHAIAPR
jgi:hypothetical protein